ncbi:MAG: glycosyltransferase [Candidatus Dojkabacteria bacterium]
MTVINSKKYKVALVTESLWSMAGANRVLEVFAEMFPDADIYALFGDREKISYKLNSHRIYFSFLNKMPGISKIYRYTFNFWPLCIEKFDFSDYDLVISSSSSVAHGVITPLGCKHIAYIHSPMRYAWDLNHSYSKIVNFSIVKKAIVDISLNFMRVWDTSASRRPDKVIANSFFVKDRIMKYWDITSSFVIHPPVDMYKGKIKSKRSNYFVCGSPFEPNKGGVNILEYINEMGITVKLIGDGSLRKKLQRKYRKNKNIEFLGWISEEEKWKILSKAKGYIVPGVEDYGIFTCEALSCGTPVLAYGKGGSLEIVKDGKNGFFYIEDNMKEFKSSMGLFLKKEWNYEKIAKDLRYVNTKEMFKKEIGKILVDNE